MKTFIFWNSDSKSFSASSSKFSSDSKELIRSCGLGCGLGSASAAELSFYIEKIAQQSQHLENLKGESSSLKLQTENNLESHIKGWLTTQHKLVSRTPNIDRRVYRKEYRAIYGQTISWMTHEAASHIFCNSVTHKINNKVCLNLAPYFNTWYVSSTFTVEFFHFSHYRVLLKKTKKVKICQLKICFNIM